MATSSTSAKQAGKSPRPVIVITGANSGVGFGLAQRLLVQLSSPTPSDTLPTHPHLTKRDVTVPPTPFAAPEGCTLIMACRNAMKAHRARAQLLNLLHYLEELPDEAETPTHIPAAVLDQSTDIKINGHIDEDADPALVAQAMEASLRRRRRRNAAISNAKENGFSVAGEGSEPKDLTRDPRTGRTYSMREREAKARGRYRKRFVAGTKIEIQAIDLGSMASALQCAKDITARHGYVTHVVMNAGSAAFTGINWPHAIWMMMINFHKAVTYPAYKTQRAGDVGKDGYGWVWQANVGAHYILARALLPALRATPYSTPSRIIWTSSLEASEAAYDPTDFQCTDKLKSPYPYESVKYQCELAAHGLEDLLNKRRLRTEPGTPLIDEAGSYLDMRGANHAGHTMEPKSLLAHPGVVASSIFAECLNAFLAAMMHLAFYFARWTFSQHHCIEGYKGAIAASHVALAPLPQLDPNARYGSQCDWHGREYVFKGQKLAWNAEQPSGLAKEVKTSIVEKYLKRNTNHGLPAKPSEVVNALSRDLIIRCEGVARSVWKQAHDGALAPFGELELEEENGELDAAEKEADDRVNAYRSIQKSNLISHSSQLLPKSNKQKGNGNSQIVSPEIASAKDTSLSSQEDWEKVEKSI